MSKTHHGFYQKGFQNPSHKLKVIAKMREMLVKGKKGIKSKKMHDVDQPKLPEQPRIAKK